MIDLDAGGRVVGIEVQWASRKFDVERMRATLERAPAARSA